MPKFTLEQLTENISKKFTNAEGKTSLQLSERTVKETLSSLLPFAGEEVELDAFTETVFPIVDSANRNYIKDTTDFTKKYKPQTPPAIPPKTEPATTDPEVLKRLEAMEEFQKKYQADQARLESERKLSVLSEAVKKALIDEGCTVELVRDNATYKTGIDIEKSVEDNVKAIKASYDSTLSESIRNGVIPQASVPHSVKSLTSEEHAKQAKEIGEKLKNFH